MYAATAVWWSLHQRPHPTRRPDGRWTFVEAEDEPAAPSPGGQLAPAVLPGSAPDELHRAALLAAQVHAAGPPVVGAVAAAAVLQRLTEQGDPRRFQAWLLQGLYHRLAAAEASRAKRGDAVVRAHEVRARGVLRLAATSHDPATSRRALAALGRLAEAEPV